MRGKNLSLMCDKGDGDRKRDGASFVKLLARYCTLQARVLVRSFGIESAGNSSIDAAEAIDHALKQYDCLGCRILLANHGTDAGGGGTRKDLADKLQDLDRVLNYIEYIYSTCSLRGLNLCLSSPTTLTMGDGGLLKIHALQCLHTAYNLLQQYHSTEWMDLWLVLSGSQTKGVKCPIMSRWKCVGDTVDNVMTYKEEWLVVSKNITNTEPSGSAKHTIASYLCSYLKEPMIIAHISFLSAYCKAWWNYHFQWQKHIHSRTKTPVFLGCHMALHYYVQSRDIDNIISGWK